MTKTTCNSCGEERDTDELLRIHLKSERTYERALGWSNPRDRIMLALTGKDHEVVTPDVTRRAMSAHAR